MAPTQYGAGGYRGFVRNRLILGRAETKAMLPPPLSKMRTPLNALLLTGGLLAVAILTLPDLPQAQRSGFGILLVVIWAVYAIQLLGTLRNRPAFDRGNWRAGLIIDALAVAVPLAALLMRVSIRDASLFCGIWILKPLKDSTAVRLMSTVLIKEARNLLGVMGLFGIVLFTASLAAYVIERGGQPEQFGSIPKAMWWGVATLSTTGYGDEIPMTLAGRILAGVVMMGGIGVFALWAGILATGFSEEIRRQDFARKWQLVSAVPLFRLLESSELMGIVRALRPMNLPAGSVVCRKGETGNQMFFIVDGRVGVDIEAAVPVELAPGAFFGEMALITGGPRTATVTALTPLSLLSLSTVDFQILVSHNPAIAETIRTTALERSGGHPGS